MNDLSFRRWQEFADRMARSCFADSKDPDLAFILGEIDSFFACQGRWEIAAFSSWDNSGPYPRESGYFASPRRGCKCRSDLSWMAGEACKTSGADRWHYGDGVAPNPDCETCGGDPDWRRMATGSYPCDIVLDQEFEALPFWECDSCRHHDRTGITEFFTAKRAGLTEIQAQSYGEWRSAKYPWWECSCDDDRYAWEEASIEKWFGPVRCCLRAGIDFANDAHGGGVIGFTAGDVRRMWPEGVPEWVFGKDQRLFEGPLAGPFVQNGTFAELPDESGVVL